MEAISLEAKFFLVSILYGVLILLAYDILRIIRRIIVHAWFWLAIEDILFWIISGFCIFQMMYVQNSGALRGFSVVGMGIGMIGYHYTISEYAVDGITFLFKKIIEIIIKIIKTVWKPFGWFCRRVRWTFGWLGKKLKKVVKTFVKSLKKTFKRVKIIKSKQ